MLGDAVRTPETAMGWKNYYEAGRAGIAMERVGEIPGAPQVAPQVAFAAYSAGENDRAAQAQTGLQAAERGTMEADHAEGAGQHGGQAEVDLGRGRHGFQKRIPLDKWPEAKRTYAELQAAARKLGRSEEEAAQFNLRIVKEEPLDG